MKRFLLLLLLPLFSFGQHIKHSGGPDPRQSGLMGYAMTSGSTTGGAGGTIVYVYTLEQLKTAAAGGSAAIIYIGASINGSGNDAVYPTSNKTFIGTPGTILTGISIRLYTVSNVILQNLTMANYKTDNGIIIKDATDHVWIDHCDFSTDRNNDWDYWGKDIAISTGSDYITISWCKFHDTNLSVLISAGIDGTNAGTDIGHLHVTMHHNLWYNVSEREPDMNYGSVHLFNNYHVGNGGYSVGSRAAGNVRTDNEYFEGCAKPITTNLGGYAPGYISGQTTNIYHNSGANDITTTTPNWSPSYSYAEYLDPAANVPAIVLAGAGVPRTVVAPSYIQTSDFIGTNQALGGTIKAIPAGVPFSSFTANRAMVDGRMEIVPIYIKTQTVLTGVKTVLQTAGVYTSDNYNGALLYGQHLGTLTLLAYSNDNSTLWKATANTLVTIPFDLAASVAPGLYYVVIIYNSSAQSTAPKIYSSVDYSQTLWNIFALTNSNIMYGVKTSITSPPSPFAASTISSTADAIPFVVVY